MTPNFRLRTLVEVALGGPAGELVAVRELQLAQHRADVRLDGLRRDPEAQRDLLVEIAAREVPEHLALARRELVEVGVRRRGRLAGEGVEDEAGQPRREDGVAL